MDEEVKVEVKSDVKQAFKLIEIRILEKFYYSKLFTMHTLQQPALIAIHGDMITRDGHIMSQLPGTRSHMMLNLLPD